MFDSSLTTKATGYLRVYFQRQNGNVGSIFHDPAGRLAGMDEPQHSVVLISP